LSAVRRPSPSPNRYIGQRLRVAAILWYRRWLAGRGPLARVRCTFAHTESCSAFGLRVALREARSLVEALKLILRRLRRCGAASLYELPDAVSWGEIYDDCDPAELDARLAEDREIASTRALLHRSAGLVAVRCGRRDDAREHLARSVALCNPSPRPCVRRTTRLARTLRVRLWRRLVLLSALAAVLGLSLSGPALWIGFGAVLAGALVSTAAHRRRARRHASLEAASAFTVPMEPG
jgi:putative component of membrane protein insertase Oxa1/YidC/SpoIIIJ protein YidD